MGFIRASAGERSDIGVTRGPFQIFGRAPLLPLVLVVLGLPAAPALAATGSGTANAVTLRPLSLVNTEDLDFGTIVAGTTAGTVRINENTGVRTTTGGAVAAGGTPNRAEFQGLARFGVLATVAISAAPTLTNGTGGTMASTLAVQGGTGLRIFPGTGVLFFYVGGTIAVATNQQPGNYAGNFSLTVNYF